MAESEGSEEDGHAGNDVQNSHGNASLTQNELAVRKWRATGMEPAFTKFADASRIEVWFLISREANLSTGALMPASGELIRSMNYVEDITTTLRRICISIPPMTTEERKRLAESLRTAVGAINAAIADLEKAGPQ